MKREEGTGRGGVRRIVVDEEEAEDGQAKGRRVVGTTPWLSQHRGRQ